jgi:hypothetical protein
MLDAEKFQRCFVAWVAAQTGASADVIAIDGKTLRGSYQKKGAKAPIHMISAFAARQRLLLEADQSGGEVQRNRRDPQAARFAGH